VRAAAERAVGACRQGSGPYLIEALTYRHHGHYEGDPARYREESELEQWQLRDPIVMATRALEEAGRGPEAEAALTAAEAEMDRAVQEGLAAPHPSTDVLLGDVYA
jgi:TPP-dependent pyruvate/acetoin dehydrogenase alpha subunit